MNISQLSSRFFVTGQITPDDVGDLAEQGFKTIVNNRPDHESPGQPLSDDIASAAAERGLEYVYLPVVSGRITYENVEDFSRVRDELQEPVLLFCRTGQRCTMLWQLSGGGQV